MKKYILLILMIVCSITANAQSDVKLLGIPIDSKPEYILSELKDKGWGHPNPLLKAQLIKSFKELFTDVELSKIQINCLQGQFVGKPAMITMISYINEVAYMQIILMGNNTEEDFDSLCYLYISKYGKDFETEDDEEIKMLQWLIGDEFVEISFDKEEKYGNIVIGYGNFLKRMKLFMSDTERDSDYIYDI